MTNDRLSQWKGFALCRQFSVAHFGSLSSTALADDSDGRVHLSVVWGVGRLADGQRELLGVWPRLTEDSATWSYVLADLWMRGVERIEQAVNLGLASPQANNLASRTRVDRWCDADGLSLPTSGSARRRMQLAAETNLAQRAQALLLRSTCRQSQFESEEAAIALVGRRLERIEWHRAVARQRTLS